jgi:peptide/nickel transport system substrate-binding protein
MSSTSVAPTGAKLRVGAAGKGTSETLDPGKLSAPTDYCRAYQVYEPLVTLGNDASAGVQYRLAEEMTANADGSVWTLRLRSGVTWHNGKSLVADDVIYTIRHALDSKNFAAGTYAIVDAAGLKKIDDLTVQIPLTSPNFMFRDSLADQNALVIPDGMTDFSHPIGTGPFSFVSWTPGDRALYTRNANYWRGVPALGGIEIISIDDPLARVNALLSNAVDAIDSVPATSIPSLQQSGRTSVNSTPSGTWATWAMKTTVKPFDDPRVREAMRLLVNREQTVQNALGGRARIANDLFGWWDPNYAGSLTQRTYDPDQAKSLLKQAGHEGLTFTMASSSGLPGGIDDATVLFASSAAAGGVTINIKEVALADFWTPDNYQNAPIHPTYWGARTINSQFEASLVPSPVNNNDTHWSNAAWTASFQAAKASSNAAAQRQHLVDAQTQLHESGGYIIPYFMNLNTATSSKIAGMQYGIRQPFGDWDFTKITVS